MVGIPFDIPIFILMYRKDLFDKHGIKVPTTMDEYMDGGEGDRRGREGQRHLRHHRPAASPATTRSNCDWTAWLWGNGGSIFGKNEHVLRQRRARASQGLDYMLELVEELPAGRHRPGPGTARASR